MSVDRKSERKRREEQEAALLRAARDAVGANLALFGQLKPILTEAAHVPSFEMDAGLLDLVLPRLAEISPDTELLAQLNDFRFQLHHINRKLDHLLREVNTVWPAGGMAVPAGAQDADALKGIDGSVVTTIDLEQSAKEKLLPAIAARLDALALP